MLVTLRATMSRAWTTAAPTTPTWCTSRNLVSKAVKARFRLDPNNPKIIERGRAGANHFLLKKSNSRLRRLRGRTSVAKADFKRMMQLLRG